jgi:hypothetical protein
MAWRRKAYRQFYFRPGRVLHTLNQNASPAALKNLWRMIAQFQDWIA